MQSRVTIVERDLARVRATLDIKPRCRIMSLTVFLTEDKMAAQRSVIVCLAVVAAVLAAPRPIGKWISPCSLKDPALNECMTKQAMALLPHIVTGVKEWGLPSLDPLKVDKIVLHNSGNQAVKLEMAGFNYTFQGYKDLEIESLTFDPKTLHMELRFKTPRFGGQGQYKTKGHILLLAISGDGYSEFSHENVRAQITMDFKRVDKGGKVFLKLDKAHYDYASATKIMHRFDNLFGDKQLSDNMNKIMNDNSQAMLKELKPAIDAAFTEMITALFEPVFDRIPLDELFKDAE